MIAIRCTRCRRKLFSAAEPAARGALPGLAARHATGGDPGEPGRLPAMAPPVQRAAESRCSDGYPSLVQFALGGGSSR